MPKPIEPRRQHAIAAAIARLFAAFPHAKPDMLEATIQVYADALADIEPAKLRTAVDELVRSERFLPAIATVRERADAVRDHQAGDVVHATTGVLLRRRGEDDDTMRWRTRVRTWSQARQDGRGAWWPADWGPTPGQPDCRVPRAVLDDFDIASLPEGIGTVTQRALAIKRRLVERTIEHHHQTIADAAARIGLEGPELVGALMPDLERAAWALACRAIHDDEPPPSVVPVTAAMWQSARERAESRRNRPMPPQPHPHPAKEAERHRHRAGVEAAAEPHIAEAPA